MFSDFVENSSNRIACDLWVSALVVSPTDAAGDSRETAITFAGARSVFGETDGTIARQKHPFSALSWRAKASRVSRKRAEDPALVLTVSSCRAANFFAETPETTASFDAPRVTGADLHRHTQRMQKRPGPWPRALPATIESR